MGGIPAIPEMAAIAPRVNLKDRVIYFPVRHHSPGCAWHVDLLIRQVKPQAVLIEGPRNATDLIPLLLDEATRLPVAIYTTYVKRQAEGLPERYSAYYPLCDYSPELAAIRAAAAVGATAEFIDLTFPEMIVAEQNPQSGRARSLHEETKFSHSAMLWAACQRTGTRNPDDLWDHLYEVDFRERSTEDFIRNVYAYCALARQEHSDEELAADGCLAREAAMAAAIEKQKGKTVVVTGGFHTIALPKTKPKMPKAVKTGENDALVALMRYGFEQLDRLNGYASGMPSPEFYQRMWQGDDIALIYVQLARECRQRNLNVSTAEAIAALHQSRSLAELRGHVHPSREDLLDGIRSVFIKGADDIEGAPILALARKMLAGDRVGDVPAHAGLPPLVDDFRQTAVRLRLDLDRIDAKEVTLDLYRKANHREISRLMHRLSYLEVPFGDFVRGPDFVAGENLGRIQEVWKYHWSPSVESRLIELSLYGATLAEASSGRLLEEFQEIQNQGQGGRADIAMRLVLLSCRMGLHKHSQDLLDRTSVMLAEDSAFDSVVAALENLLVLSVSREPLEAQHLVGHEEMAAAAYNRACYLLPELAATPPEAEDLMVNSLNALALAVRTLGDTADRQELRWRQLAQLAAHAEANPVLRGAAIGLLYGDGQLTEDQLAGEIRGHLLSTAYEGAAGPGFLRGLLRTARSVMWQTPACVECLNEMLSEWEEAKFVKQLPLLRLALAELTPRECDRVAKKVTEQTGGELKILKFAAGDEALLLHALEVNRRVEETLKRDGLAGG